MSIRELFWGIINFNFSGVLSGAFFIVLLLLASIMLFVFVVLVWATVQDIMKQ